MGRTQDDRSLVSEVPERDCTAIGRRGADLPGRAAAVAAIRQNCVPIVEGPATLRVRETDRVPEPVVDQFAKKEKTLRSPLAIILVPLALLAMPVAAQKVIVDYDRNADFTSYKTYAWLDTDETSLEKSDPLMHTRIRNEIELRMSDGEMGLKRVEADPDVVITYHTSGTEEVRLTTTSMGGYGYGGGWGYSPYWGRGGYGYGGYGGGVSTTTAHVYVEGSLVVDIYDARTKKALWRGTAEAVVPDNPGKAEAKIVKAIDKMAKIWAKEYRKKY